MNIGIIGTGNMGRAMAERLRDQGAALTVWNRDRTKAEAIAGVRVAESPSDLAEKVDVIVSALANDAAIAAVYHGPAGLCHGPLTGKLVIETCTTLPATARALEAAIVACDGLFLECPVGGTTGPAREGQLLGLAGGSPEAFAKGAPILKLLTRRLEHLGPVGAGAAMKLAINLPLMVYWAALGEALGLALGEGIDAAQALDVLADSSGAIGAAKKRVPPIAAMLATGQGGAVNFSLENAIKDMGLMADLARSHGHAPDVIEAALHKARRAAPEGFAALDCSMVGLHPLKTSKT